MGRRAHGRCDVMVAERDAVTGNRLYAWQRIIVVGEQMIRSLVNDHEDDVIRRLAGLRSNRLTLLSLRDGMPENHYQAHGCQQSQAAVEESLFHGGYPCTLSNHNIPVRCACLTPCERLHRLLLVRGPKEPTVRQDFSSVPQNWIGRNCPKVQLRLFGHSQSKLHGLGTACLKQANSLPKCGINRISQGRSAGARHEPSNHEGVWAGKLSGRKLLRKANPTMGGLCGRRIGLRRGASFASCGGRRRRRELLDSWIFREPRGRSSTAGMVAGDSQLS